MKLFSTVFIGGGAKTCCPVGCLTSWEKIVVVTVGKPSHGDKDTTERVAGLFQEEVEYALQVLQPDLFSAGGGGCRFSRFTAPPSGNTLWLGLFGDDLISRSDSHQSTLGAEFSSNTPSAVDLTLSHQWASPEVWRSELSAFKWNFCFPAWWITRVVIKLKYQMTEVTSPQSSALYKLQPPWVSWQPFNPLRVTQTDNWI